MTRKHFLAAAALSMALTLAADAASRHHGHAYGACGDTYYSTVRSSRISLIIAGAPPGATFWVGDSHVERASETYAQGSMTLGGHPLILVGSAGATWATLRDCIPWGAIAAKVPHNIVLQSSVNDAAGGSCCDGAGNGTIAYIQAIMATITSAKTAVPSPVIATDPPPESAAGIDAYKFHQASRGVYYVATNCGGACQWADFGWGGANLSPPLQFIDLRSLMAAGSCDPSSIAWAGHSCVAAVGSTLDNVHFPYTGITTMFNNLTGVP